MSTVAATEPSTGPLSEPSVRTPPENDEPAGEPEGDYLAISKR